MRKCKAINPGTRDTKIDMNAPRITSRVPPKKYRNKSSISIKVKMRKCVWRRLLYIRKEILYHMIPLTPQEY